MRTVDDRQRDPTCRHVDCRRVFLWRRRGRARNPSAGRRALPARGLELGAKRRRHGNPWLEAREWFSPLPLAGLLRGDDFLYLLGLGSPTHPLPRESWARWASTYDWRTIYDHELLYAGPLFIHQFSHIWIDFRGIQDDYMRDKRIDYFENSRRATYVHQQYAIANPARYDAYGENSWGITASDGPGPATYKIKGEKGASSATNSEARLTALTTAASLLGRSPPLSLSRPRSCSRR